MEKSREEVLSDLESELNALRDAGVDLSLGSERLYASQVEKSRDRIKVVQKLRADSLARAALHRIGPNRLPR